MKLKKTVVSFLKLKWFVTHSSTPHLNGRYTIFANVTEGMEIVDILEVGDRILRMSSVYK
jgi:cyclophilin family peptidyl-prolyl cis-trans isomerase